jgi:hypothetical protein
MSISYVGKAFVLNSTSGTSCVVPMPSTVAAGHKLFVLIGSVGANSGSVTAPSGWTLVKELLTGSALRVQLYSRVATSADASATYTWTFPSAGRNFGYSVAYSGVDTTVTDLADATGDTNSGTGPWATPSLALSAGDWLITAAVARENPGTSTAKNWTSSDTSDIERYDLTTDSAPSINVSASLFDSGRALPAGTVTRSLTENGAAFSQSQVWAVRVPALADVVSTSNPWTAAGIPIR